MWINTIQLEQTKPDLSSVLRSLRDRRVATHSSRAGNV